MNGGKSQAWAAVAIWLVIQLTLTSLPGNDLPSGINHPWDWGAHFSMYAGLGFLVARGAMLRAWHPRRLAWAVLAFSVMGALDELHQLFIPGRDAEVFDWVFDTLGGAAGTIVGFFVMRTRFAKWLR